MSAQESVNSVLSTNHPIPLRFYEADYYVNDTQNLGVILPKKKKENFYTELSL